MKENLDFHPVSGKMEWSRVSGRAGKLFAGSPAPRHRVLDPANATFSQFERAVLCRDNPLTKDMQSVSNFSAQCNERPSNNGPIPISEQNETQILFFIGVFPGAGGVLDRFLGDTSWSLRGARKNLGYKCQPEISTKGGVACRDESWIVSLDSELERVKSLLALRALTPQGNPRCVQNATVSRRSEVKNVEGGMNLSIPTTDAQVLTELKKISSQIDTGNKSLATIATKVGAVSDQIATLIKLLTPPQPYGFRVVLTPTNSNNSASIGDEIMSAGKMKASLSQTLNDDGTLNVNLTFTDTKGLAETYTTWPTQVALAAAVFSDATPGPSSAVFTPAPSIAPSTDVAGALVVGTVGFGTPPSPLPAGWGQNVDVQIVIASGLVGQTAPVSQDAGTISAIADPNNPGSFVPSLQN